MADDLRHAPRFNLPDIDAALDGRSFTVADVSSSGLKLSGEVGTLARGDAVSVVLVVPVLGRRVPLSVDGFVVRADSGVVAVNYVYPSRTWAKLLEVLDAKQK